jgi:unsaturated rhamnogalacturonyl hydrolase
VKEHLRDRASGLYYHGWDAKKVQAWANPATGVSSNFWGRAVGWYVMALVDTLDYLPANHPGRKQLVGQLEDLSKALVKYQDHDNGVWWQVMDKANVKSNYLEATASAMFVYAMAKGVNNGELSRSYVPAILKGYQGILNEFVRTNASGSVSLVQCCQVAGLGFTSMRGGPRDGSYAYYVSEPIVENDLKGIGPFILAGIEIQRLLGLPMTIKPIAAQERLPGDESSHSVGVAEWPTPAIPK